MQTTARVERIAMLLDRASRGKKSSFFPGAASVDTCAAPSAVTSAAAQKGFHLVATDSAQAAPAPARQSRQPQCSSAVRAWRFPSSRRFLWDRTPVAPCVHLHPQMFLPTIVARQQAFVALEAEPSVQQEVRIPAEWQLNSSNTVSLFVGAGSSELPHSTFSLPVGLAQQEPHACCFGDTALQTAQQLTKAVETGLNARNAVSIAQTYCVSCHSSGAQLHCHVAIPGAAVLLTPLYAKKVCQVPLSQPLQEGESSAALPQTGLLSMDQARSLLPLLSDDPNAYGTPLVGVWVSGVASPSHPIVWLACLKFYASSQLKDKASQGDQAFLLLLYPAGSSGQPSCYEVKVDAPGHRIAVLSLRCAATRPNKGDAVCAMVPMRNAHSHIDVVQGNAGLQGDADSRPSSSHSWRSPSLSKGHTSMELKLAPRRQSLPVPHTSSSQHLQSSHQEPSVTQSTHTVLHPPRQADSAAPPSPVQSRFSMCNQKPTAHSWAWSQQSPHSSTSTADQQASALSHPSSINNMAAGVAGGYNPSKTSHQSVEHQEHGSPSPSPHQAVPSVSITINGACVCQSPERQQAVLSQSHELEQQQPPGLNFLGRNQQQHQAGQALDHEASLAHLHQQPAALYGAQCNSLPTALLAAVLPASLSAHSRSPQVGSSGRAPHLQTSLARAESDATSREAVGAAAQVEGDAATSTALVKEGCAASAQHGHNMAGGSGNTAPAGAIDTAALQQEVSQLRQQLQELMLQMATQAGASERKPSRSVANSTSTLWPPSIAPDPHRQAACGNTTDPLDPAFLQRPFLQPHLGAETVQQAELSQQDVGQVQESSGDEDTAEPSSAFQVADHAALTAVPAAPSSSQPDSLPKHVNPHGGHVPTGDADVLQHQGMHMRRHHDASQPWGSSGKQPSRARQSMPTGQAALVGITCRPQQLRRSTVPDVPSRHASGAFEAATRDVAEQAGQQHTRGTATAGHLQGSAKPSSRLPAARSLSWSHQAADSPLLHQHSSGLQQMEPATPQAGGGLNREDPSCTSIASSNPNTLAAFKLGAGDPLGARMIEHAWPKIGGQWGMQQEVVQVGQALLECSIQQSAEDVTDRLRLSAGSTGAKPDAFALPQDPDEGPLLITSASPLRPSHPARSAEVVSAASSQAGDHLRLSGSGKGMMTVVRTQFVPLSDSLSDSDSDAEDLRLEQKYGIIRSCRRKSTHAASQRDSTTSCFPDMSLDSRVYLQMHGVWQPGHDF